jgi:hypothetical protein
MGEYVPVAPINDEAKKHNQNLPGMGGVYNYINLHVYHYAGNNPVKLTDPDGRISGFVTDISNPVGHSGMFVETYDRRGNFTGFSFFEVNPVDKNADDTHGAAPLTPWMAALGGSSGSSSSGSSSSSTTSGVIVNEVAVRVGVNQYNFKTKAEMDAFIKERFGGGNYREAVLGTSMKQDRAIYTAAVTEWKSSKRYDVARNNCAQYASKVLAAGGVKTSTQMYPRWSQDYIEKNNPDILISAGLK